MNIEKIAVNGHYVWVDEAVGWSHNGICYNDDGTIGKPINSNSKKIIASSSELNLEGVPTYVEWLEANYYRELEKRREVAKNFGGQVAGRHPDMFGHNEVHHMVRGYLEGYQRAEQDNPTWDDVRMALSEAFKANQDGYDITTEEIIEKIKQSKIK